MTLFQNASICVIVITHGHTTRVAYHVERPQLEKSADGFMPKVVEVQILDAELLQHEAPGRFQAFGRVAENPPLRLDADADQRVPGLH